MLNRGRHRSKALGQNGRWRQSPTMLLMMMMPDSAATAAMVSDVPSLYKVRRTADCRAQVALTDQLFTWKMEHTELDQLKQVIKIDFIRLLFFFRSCIAGCVVVTKVYQIDRLNLRRERMSNLACCMCHTEYWCFLQGVRYNNRYNIYLTYLFVFYQLSNCSKLTQFFL